MEFKGTRLEKLSVFFSIYLLLAISVSLSVAAVTKPFSGSITIRDVNNPWNMEVILDKYSQDALTVMEIDVMSCEMEMACGQENCGIPYSVVVDGVGIPEDEAGNEKNVLVLCEHINDDGERITFVVDPKRWTTVAVKFISDTKLEYYLMNQTTYSIAYTQMQGDVTVHTIQHAGRVRKIVADVASVDMVLCSADLLGEAKIECNEQAMEIYAMIATYWYFVTHLWEFILASLKSYRGICSAINWIVNKFGDLSSIFDIKGNKYAAKLLQYEDQVGGLATDAQGLYNTADAYAEAADSCKGAYEYIKGLFDSVLGLIDKIKGYLRFLDDPLPSCLGSSLDKLRRISDKLNYVIPDFIPEMDNLLGTLDDLYPECIQDFLDKLDDFKNLLSRFESVYPVYCAKVQKMKEYYEDPARGNDPEMAGKYADLYLSCEDGSWADLSFEALLSSQCTGLEQLTPSVLLPPECEGLSAMDLSYQFDDFIPDMTELPDTCTDYKSALGELLACDGLDLDAYKDKYRDVVVDEEVKC